MDFEDERSFVPISKMKGFVNHLAGDDAERRKMLHAIQVINAWEKVAEPTVLDHTDNIFLFMKDGKRTLICYVDSPMWAAELNADSFRFRIGMERELGCGPIEVVKFITSRDSYERKQFQKKTEQTPDYIEDVEPVPLSPEELRKVEEQAEKITSPVLRKTLLEARIKDMEWKKGISSSKSR